MPISFVTNFNESIPETILTYIIDECSFYMNPFCEKVKYSLLVNYIDLTVNSHDNIVHLSGFSPAVLNGLSIDTSVPPYNRGILSIKSRLESGLSYRINNREWPVYRNYKTGWTCIGDYQKSGIVIEFLNDCVAVINHEKLKAIWLKPRFV
jgi:hypothetical protein